jgi:predicted PurR-regulated permease PerM
MSLQALLFSTFLLIIGIKNAVLLGCIAGLLSIMPYIGPVLGGVFPLLMALITEDTTQPAILVVIMLVVIQTIDNYFIEPVVVGGEVALSAISTILILIIGGTLWGPVGMIVFIPILGIAKIIFDHVDSLKPYGYLIGDPDERKPSKLKLWLDKTFKKSTGKRKRKLS